MTTRKLDYEAPPQIAVQIGATSPRPGDLAQGTYAWSTADRAIVCWDGVRWVRAGYEAEYLYGLGTDQGTAWYQTAIDAGEPGVAAGWGEAYLCHINTLPAVIRRIGGRWGGVGVGGNLLQLDASNNLDAFAMPTNTAASASARQTLTPSDAGKVSLFGWVVTGSEVRSYRWNQLMHSATCVGYTPATGYRTTHGAGDSGVSPFLEGSVIARIQYRGVPTTAQWKELSDATRALGDFPPYWPGVTLTHRWSLKDLLRSLTEQPLGNLSAGRYLGTTTGLRGHASNMWRAAWIEWGAITGSESIAAALDATSGWDILKSSGAMSVGSRVSGGTYTSVNPYTLVSGDINRRMLVGLWLLNGQLSLTIDGAQVGSSVAATCVPAISAVPMKIGNEQETLLYPALSLRVSGLAGGDGVSPTATEWKQLYRDTVATGVLGRIAGKTSRRWITAAKPPHLGAVITDLENSGDNLVTYGNVQRVAPAALPESVTALENDIMVAMGANPLVIKPLDPTFDGRKLLGAQGAAVTSYLEAQTAGIRGSATTGMTIIIAMRVTENQSGVGAHFVNNYSVAGSTGYAMYGVSGTIYGYVVGAGAAFSYAVTSKDFGRILVWGMTFNGTFWRGYVDGIQVGTDFVQSWVPTTTAPMRVGRRTDTDTLGSAAGFFAIAGCDEALSRAEMAQIVANFDRTGLLTLPTGKINPHEYNFSLDFAASSNVDNAIPLTFLDRAGTDHLVSWGGWRVSDGGLRSAEQPSIGDTTYTYLRTLASNFPGTTTPWSVAVTWYDYGLTLGGPETLVGQAPLNITLGWMFMINPTNTLLLYVRANGALQTLTFVFPGGAPAIGPHEAAVTYDGSIFRLYYDGAQVAVSGSGLVFEPAPAEPLLFGGHRASSPLYGVRTKSLLGAYAGSVTWTAGEVSTACAAAVAAGKPIGVPTKTVKLWSFPDDTQEAGGRVPVTSKERVSGAAADQVVVIGSGMQTATRVERSHTYETKPIRYGASAFTNAAYFHSATGGAGNTIAFGGTLVWTPKTGASATRVLLSTLMSGPSRGYDVHTSGANSTISALLINAAAGNVSSGSGVLTALSNRLSVFSWLFEGVSQKLRIFLNRTEVGTGVTCVGFTPGDGGIRFGHEYAGTTTPAIDSDAFGFMLFDGMVSLAQVQAQHEAILGNDGRVQLMPGANTSMLIDLFLDVQENGGLLGATLKDRVGRNNMTRTGAPTTVTINHRAFGF